MSTPLEIICASLRGLKRIRCAGWLMAWMSFAPWAWAQEVEFAYSVLGPGHGAVLRSISTQPTCPVAHWDNGTQTRLHLRSQAVTLPSRPDQLQPEHIDADFPVWVCEAPWPSDAENARLAQHVLKGPKRSYQKILILGDSGCRLKASEHAYQDCLDPVSWPFPTLARLAAAMQPDVVMHMGDMHYRESPCPSQRSGCAGSPWGYGWPAWHADFFQPAQPLLSVPWILVRGNHESCARAGQGWMRFLDPRPFDPGLSCDDPANDSKADFSPPYDVALNELTRVWLFDSSKANGKASSAVDPVATTHLALLSGLQAARPQEFNVFLSHHPHSALVQTPQGVVSEAGTVGLQSVLRQAFGPQMLPPQFQLTLHGHLHLFEAQMAEPGHASTLIMGNSGSMMEAKPPMQASPHQVMAHGGQLKQLASQPGYGFAWLERSPKGGATDWLLTEYDTRGQAVVQCQISPETMNCRTLSSEQAVLQ